MGFNDLMGYLVGYKLEVNLSIWGSIVIWWDLISSDLMGNDCDLMGIIILERFRSALEIAHKIWFVSFCIHIFPKASLGQGCPASKPGSSILWATGLKAEQVHSMLDHSFIFLPCSFFEPQVHSSSSFWREALHGCGSCFLLVGPVRR